MQQAICGYSKTLLVKVTRVQKDLIRPLHEPKYHLILGKPPHRPKWTKVPLNEWQFHFSNTNITIDILQQQIKAALF